MNETILTIQGLENAFVNKCVNDLEEFSSKLYEKLQREKITRWVDISNCILNERTYVNYYLISTLNGVCTKDGLALNILANKLSTSLIHVVLPDVLPFTAKVAAIVYTLNNDCGIKIACEGNPRKYLNELTVVIQAYRKLMSM